MPDFDYTGLTLSVYHEADNFDPATHHKPDSVELGAGFFVIGVELDGAFVKLARVKAGGVLDDQARAEQAQKSQPEQSE